MLWTVLFYRFIMLLNKTHRHRILLYNNRQKLSKMILNHCTTSQFAKFLPTSKTWLPKWYILPLEAVSSVISKWIHSEAVSEVAKINANAVQIFVAFVLEYYFTKSWNLGLFFGNRTTSDLFLSSTVWKMQLRSSTLRSDLKIMLLGKLLMTLRTCICVPTFDIGQHFFSCLHEDLGLEMSWEDEPRK